MNKTFTIHDFFRVMRRRSKLFLLTFSAVVFASLIIAIFLPPVYRSAAVIRIDQQQVSEDLIKTTVAGYAEQRLAMISEKVLSYRQLEEIIRELNVYPQLREKGSLPELVQKLRRNIEIETKGSNITNTQGGRLFDFTTAFILSYEGEDPQTVQNVANKLASLFVEEDEKAREKLSSATTIFFTEEIEGLKYQIRDHEETIKQYKEAHVGELPEYTATNLRTYDNLQRELDNVLMRIRSLEDRKIYLKGQIATVDPLVPIVTDEGKLAMNPYERLKRYRLDLLNLQSNLTEKHPDVVKLKKTIKELEASIGESDAAVEKIKRLDGLRAELATLNGKYGPKHPDVKKLEKEMENLSKEVDKLLTEKAEMSVATEKPDNPLFINLMTQIVSADTEIKGLLGDKEKIEKEIKKYSKRIENAPLVEREYKDLTRDYESAKHKYNEIINKLMEARLAQGLDETQRGERVSIVNTAYLPKNPVKPNRFAIILLGIMLGLGIGVSLAAIQENMDNTLKSADELNLLTGVSVFTVIPVVETALEKRRRKIKRIVTPLIIIGSFAIILVIIHTLIIPLDNLWMKIQE